MRINFKYSGRNVRVSTLGHVCCKRVLLTLPDVLRVHLRLVGIRSGPILWWHTRHDRLLSLFLVEDMLDVYHTCHLHSKIFSNLSRLWFKINVLLSVYYALYFMYRAFSSLISSNSCLWNTSRMNFRGGAICWDGSRVFPRCCAFQVTWFISGASHPELPQRYRISCRRELYI